MRFHGISFEYIFWHNVYSRDGPAGEPQWYSFLNMNMKMVYGYRSHIISSEWQNRAHISFEMKILSSLEYLKKRSVCVCSTFIS